MIRYAPRNPSTRLGRRFLKPLPVDMEPVAVAITLPDFGVASADQLVFDAMTVSLAMPDFASTGVGVTDFDTLAIAVTMPDFGIVEQAVTLFDPMVVAVTLPDFAVLDQGVIQFEPIAVSVTMPDFADVAAGVTPFEPIAVSISMPDFTEIEATVTPFDPIAVSVSMPDFIVLGQAVTTFDPMAVAVTLPDFASLGAFITGFDPLAVAVTMPDFGVLAAGVTTFDAMTVSVALPDFTVVAPVAAITIDSIGPQQSSGDVPVSYSIDMNDATVEAVLFLATDPDPAAADFNTGATTGYIDIGQVALTTAGSGITLTGPDDLLGNYKLAYLPTGGGDADVAVSASFALDSTATVISPSAFVTGSASGEVDWSFTPDEAGTYRVSIYADGATPSNADIAAGTGAVATVTGSGIAATGESGTLTGTAATAYDGYIYYLDSFGNDIIVGPVDVTSAAGDVTAPTLSSPVDNANGGTAATGSVDTNEGNGTLYWVVTQSGTAPSAAQVKAGNDHTGSPADDSGSQSVVGTGTQSLSPAPSGLTSETSYFIHFMHEDAATNQSAVASGDGFTTADVTAPTLSSTAPADNATDIAVDVAIDLVFSETVTLETGNIVLRENSAGFADLETFNVATGAGDNGGTVALATTSVTDDTVRITPGANLANNVEHAVRVAATAIDDVAGNSFAGISDDTTVSFTTVAAASFSPADLFGSGEDGFILAPGDAALNELWQENDGTQVTPSGNGDAVGEVVCLTTGRAARAPTSPVRLSAGGVEAITFGPTETGFSTFVPSLPVDDFAVYIAFRILGFNIGSNGEMTPVTTANGGTGNGLQMLMHSRTAGTPNTWEMGLFNVNTFNIDSPTGAFDENVFYRLCGQTPNAGDFYVDGSTDGSYAFSEGGTDPSIGFDVNNAGRDVYGDIALLVIIDRALTAGEIAQLDAYAAARIV